MTSLHSAARNGHLDMVKCLISEGAEVDEEENDGWTSLHFACANGHLDVAKYFISEGAQVDKEENDGWTSLHFACRNGHLDVAKYLISEGAEVDKEENDGRTSLHLACENGLLEVAKYLISEGAEVDKVENKRWTSLHFACANGHLEVAKYLTGEGAKVDMKENDGCTSLHLACKNGHLEVAKYLISEGAEVDEEEKDGWTSLHLACKNGNLYVANFLISEGAEVGKEENDGRTSLHFACANGHLEVAKYLISEGAEVDKKRNNGKTSLHLACENGHLEVAKYLISEGAEVDMEENDGWTSLHLAAGNGNVDIIRYLISQRAVESKEDKDGLTPFHRAAQNGHTEAMKFLLKLVDVCRPIILTALHLSAANGQIDVTRYLVEHGAELNGTKSDGWNALHLAAEQGHLDVTTYLLSQGIEMNMGDTDGYTPLHFAALKGHLTIAKALLTEGAQVDVRNANGQTPLHLSSKEGHVDICNLLAEQAQGSVNLDHRDENGSTAIHVATQYGHSSVVDILVSHGADVNIPSADGKTCLHEAVILSEGMGRTVQTTAALQQISADFYQNELPPEKALVFYLLDHGAKVKIRDNQRKLPIHYTTSEVVKQIFSGLSSRELIRSYRGHPGFTELFSQTTIDHKGGELQLEEPGIRISFPEGAIPIGMRSEVSIKIPSRDTGRIPLQEGEVLITPVVECSSTQELLKPATVCLPHYFHLDQCQDQSNVILYTKTGSDSFGRKDLFPPGTGGFRISKDKVDFPTRHLQLCALSSTNVQGVWFTCEVLQPVSMPPSLNPTLRVYVAHPSVRYTAEIARVQESLETFCPVMSAIKFSLESKDEDLNVWCLYDSQKAKKTIPSRGLLNGEGSTLDFDLQFLPAEEGKKSICLHVQQGSSTLIERQFSTSIEGQEEVHQPSDRDISNVPSTSCDEKIAESLQTKLHIEEVTEESLEELSANVPDTEYDSFCSKLVTGKYNRAKNILAKHSKDYKKAVRECLQEWKNETGGSPSELKRILRKVKLGGLVKHVSTK